MSTLMAVSVEVASCNEGYFATGAYPLITCVDVTKCTHQTDLVCEGSGIFIRVSGYHFDGVSFVNITECSSLNSVVAGCGSLNNANPMNSQALMNLILLLLRMKTVAMDLASI